MSLKQSHSRSLAVVALAISLVLSNVLDGCSGAKPISAPLMPSTSQAPTANTTEPCLECYKSLGIEEFICIRGGCFLLIGYDCIQCGEFLITVSTKDLDAKAGQDYRGMRDAKVWFAEGVKKAALFIETIPSRALVPKKLEVTVSVDGKLLTQKEVTLPGQ